MNNHWKKVAESIKEGFLAVIPTDTIYGVVAPALNADVVETLYDVRGRNDKKPCIVLISSIEELDLFDIRLDSETKSILSKIWPNPVSVVLPCENDKFSYLHRGTKTLALRLPKKKKLLEFLKISGPIIAPSANPEGNPPAQNIKEAKKYFGGKILCYLSGYISKKPSTIIKFESGKIKVIREGAWKVPESFK
jgi:L-threonylcarbamoyladenylate synthase